ncbi:hypothetical protein [Williamsia deligens]|uniref:Anti-sigma-M factor RsmA n=1 Tax=Williamsia deligens TaxID=321325 RepID=A0ABW3G5V4_9NOCA|nr:hypothetical protein [Williamsia deligens]MCP2193817.1 hypothetical protein [Williamsia deligens]
MTDDRTPAGEPSGESAAGEPTVPLDLIADLHAGVLSEEDARSVRARVDADPRAQRVLAALDATVADLRDAPVEPVEPPPAVAAAIEETLRSLRDEHAVPPHPADDPRVIALDAARDRRRRRGLLLAAAAAVVVAVVTGIIAVSTATQPSSDSVRADDTTPPSTQASTGAAPVSLLSVLGRTEPTLGDASDPASRLRGCLAANGVPASTAVLGAGPVTVDGDRRIVVLLTTGVAGRFDALVVGPDCAAGRAETISRQVIGATAPTR